MKKIYAILMMVVIIISAVPVFAVEGEQNALSAGNSNDTEVEAVLLDESDDAAVAEEVQGSEKESDSETVITPFSARERLREQINGQVDAYKERREAQIEAFTQLRAEQIEKFKAYKQEQIERFTALRQEQIEKFASLRQEQLDKLAALDRARLRKFANMSDEDIQDKLENIKVNKVRVENLYKKRVILKERLQDARDRYDKAKKRYQTAKENFLEAKERFQDFRELSEEEQITAAKDFLAHAGEIIIEDLEKIKAKAAENDDLTEEEYDKIIVDADARIAEVKEAMAQVEAAATKEEVKEAGKEIIKSWERVRAHIKLHVGEMVSSKVGEIIQRSEQLEKKMETVLLEMEEKGIDVADLDAKLDAFSEKIDEARTKYDRAKALFEEAKDMIKEDGLTEEAKEKARQAHELAKEAHAALKEAHSKLMEILREVKQKGGTVSLDEEDEVEVVEDSSTADV